tara:strand:+ start:2142 stop:2999 length:858 start_codon:yes stop_codon:yes gene_type:complete
MSLNCPACNNHSDDFLLLDSERLDRYLEYSDFAYDGLFHNYKDEIKPELMRCSYCLHVFYKEMPSEKLLNEMYGFQRNFKKNPSRAPSQKMIKVMEKCFKIIGKQDPVMLDYGAGHGRWSLAAVKAGFKVFAYEPHLTRTSPSKEFEFIKNKNDLNEIEFDFIWCEQVLEHVTNPFHIINDINSLSSKETIVRISVPNVDRAREGSEIWNDWPYDGRGTNHTLAPYQHIQGFNQKSLHELANRSGFTKLNNQSFIFQEPFFSLRFFLGRIIKSLSTTTLFLIKNN